MGPFLIERCILTVIKSNPFIVYRGNIVTCSLSVRNWISCGVNVFLRGVGNAMAGISVSCAALCSLSLGKVFW